MLERRRSPGLAACAARLGICHLGCHSPANKLVLLSPFHVQAYAAWLGFYNSAKGMGWDKPTLVQQANRFASECRRPPGGPALPWAAAAVSTTHSSPGISG